MTEKLNWADRSVSRMKDAKSNKDDVTVVQDHFWSFLHASQLVWFYLGAFLVARGDAKGSAKKTMKRWTTSHLSVSEQQAWDAIVNLRTEDVHTQPVETEEQQTTALAKRDGKLLVSARKLCAVTIVKYNVSFDGDEFDAIELASTGVELLRRFVADFPQLVRTQ